MFHQQCYEGKKLIFDNIVAAKAKYFIVRMASSFYAMARLFMTCFLMTDEKVSVHGEM